MARKKQQDSKSVVRERLRDSLTDYRKSSWSDSKADEFIDAVMNAVSVQAANEVNRVMESVVKRMQEGDNK